jgi:hypothetical protein
MHKAPIDACLKFIAVGVVTLSLVACSASDKTDPVPVQAAGNGVLQAPLKIPLLLDKAGQKIDVAFEIPEPPWGERSRGYFIGLRLLFAPAGVDRIPVIDAHPVAVRVTLHRMEEGEERPVQLVKLTQVSKGYEPYRSEAIPLKDGLARSEGSYSEFSGAPPGTPDASTYVLEFAAPRGDRPGRYRLKLETLDDIPQLRGFKAFLVFEQAPKR